MPPESITFQHDNEEITVNYRIQRDGKFAVEVSDTRYDIEVHRWACDEVELVINGRRSTTAVTSRGDRWLVHGVSGDVECVELARFPMGGTEGVTGGLVAPMTGNVLATHVAVGDAVEKGQLLLVLEGMKMEYQITAPESGTVEAIHVQEGDQVSHGELLIVIADEGAGNAEG